MFCAHSRDSRRRVSHAEALYVFYRAPERYTHETRIDALIQAAAGRNGPSTGPWMRRAAGQMLLSGLPRPSEDSGAALLVPDLLLGSRASIDRLVDFIAVLRAGDAVVCPDAAKRAALVRNLQHAALFDQAPPQATCLAESPSATWSGYRLQAQQWLWEQLHGLPPAEAARWRLRFHPAATNAAGQHVTSNPTRTSSPRQLRRQAGCAFEVMRALSSDAGDPLPLFLTL